MFLSCRCGANIYFLTFSFNKWFAGEAARNDAQA
jgi:hypothetical protein